VTGGPRALLVSLFNVKWRFSALAGGVEGSKLFLFSVIMPAKCVSSVSPRFHYRRLTFCFLLLASILESPSKNILTVSKIKPRNSLHFCKVAIFFLLTHEYLFNFYIAQIQPLNLLFNILIVR
jgi:hypothetical protein